MKKILQLALIVVFFANTTKGTVIAQVIDLASVGKTRPTVVEGKVNADKPFVSKENKRLIKANYRATENFARQFKNIANVRWMVFDEAIVGSFTKDDIKTMVVYNKFGGYVHSLAYSNEKTMPTDIRSLVEEAYPGFDITLCVEVHENDLVFHIVNIECKKIFKQLGIYNGEINTIQEFKKG